MATAAGPAVTTAHAQEPTRVLVIRLTGTVPDRPDLNDAFTRAASRVAAVGGAEVIDADASLADAAALAGCSPDSDGCLDAIAQQLGVAEILFGHLEPADGAGLTVALTYHRSGDTRVREFAVTDGPLDEQARVVAREAAVLLSGATEPAPQPTPPPVAEPAPTPAPAPAPPPTAPPRDQPRPGLLASMRARTWITLGASVALAGTGGVFYTLASRRQSDVDAHPSETPDDFRKLVALEDKVERYATVGNVLMVAGGAAFVAGAALLVLDSRASTSDRDTSIAVVPYRGGAGLAVSVVLP